jgi:hypothetical protein
LEDPAFVKLDVLSANGKLTDRTSFFFQAAFKAVGLGD